MTIFVFYVGPHFPNIGYFEVYEGIPIVRFLVIMAVINQKIRFGDGHTAELANFHQ